jgi:hypothetical protein
MRTNEQERGPGVRGRGVLLALGLSVMVPLAAHAGQPTVRDIVLDQVTPQAVAVAAPVAPSDAMAVSILVESTDGTLTPRSTNHLFRTGERLRVKVLASRSGKLSVYNTNPAGETKPVWSGEVQVGQETISPRMVLAGLSGEDKLHVVLEPRQAPQGVLVWLNTWLGASKSGLAGAANSNRDIQLDTQVTPQATYLVSQGGQGLVTTVRVMHTR